MSGLVVRDVHVFVELRPSGEGPYVKARIEGARDPLLRTFVGVLGSRDVTISEATGWALGWLAQIRNVVRKEA